MESEVIYTELTVVNPQEYGIEKKQATELLGNLPQLKQERFRLESEYSEVLALDINDKATSKKAKELRLRVRDNRTKGIEVWHKNAKDFFLSGGRFVDAIKKLEVAENERMEGNLEKIEKHFEIQEGIRKENLKNERLEVLKDYKEFVPMSLNFGEMAQEEFEKILNGSKLQLEQKIKQENEEKERQRIENEKAELERLEEQKRIEAQAKENETLKAEREAAESERQRIAKENAEIQAQKDAELKAEREAADLLKAELIKKEEDDKKRLKDIEDAKIQAQKEAEKLAKAPVKKQVELWVNSFELPKSSIENEVTKNISEKFEAFKAWALLQTENI